MPIAALRRRAVAAATLVALVASPAAATAATKHGITPLTPSLDRKVAQGKSAAFRMRVHGPGTVFVNICKSPRKSKADGTICHRQGIGQAHRVNGVFKWTQRFYDYPEFWLNTPGTYYWQAYRIACAKGSSKDCRQEGPVVRFRVR